MARGKRYQPYQVVNLLRQIEVAVANGKTMAQARKEAEIVEQTYFRWRKENGGLQIDQAKRPASIGTRGALRYSHFSLVQKLGQCIRRTGLQTGRGIRYRNGRAEPPQPLQNAGPTVFATIHETMEVGVAFRLDAQLPQAREPMGFLSKIGWEWSTAPVSP